MTGTNVVSELPAAHAVAAWSACAGCVKVICSFKRHMRRSICAAARSFDAMIRLESGSRKSVSRKSDALTPGLSSLLLVWPSLLLVPARDDAHKQRTESAGIVS